MIPRPLPDEALLDQVLAQPTPAVVEALSRVGGDLLVLGAGGKMGPSLCRLAARALQEAGVPHRVVAVARFSDPLVRSGLDSSGVETIACNLFDQEQVARLPDAPNIVYMVGQKFGTTGDEAGTWAVNAWLPGAIAERFAGSRFVASPPATSTR